MVQIQFANKMLKEEKLQFLGKFREKIVDYLFLGYAPSEILPSRGNKALMKVREALKQDKFQKLRSEINEMKGQVHQILSDLGVEFIFVQYPPLATGGPVLKFKLFDLITENQTLKKMYVNSFTDKIDEAIGILKTLTENSFHHEKNQSQYKVKSGLIFIAMPMVSNDSQLDDVHDAIKETSSSLGIIAERIDDSASNERITDRILKLLQKAEYVIVDLTHSKPNVYYEAGYAHALGKTPIYIARKGTVVEFDIKDYPVIFFKNIRELKTSLKNRLSGIMTLRKEQKK